MRKWKLTIRQWKKFFLLALQSLYKRTHHDYSSVAPFHLPNMAEKSTSSSINTCSCCSLLTSLSCRPSCPSLASGDITWSGSFTARCKFKSKDLLLVCLIASNCCCRVDNSNVLEWDLLCCNSSLLSWATVSLLTTKVLLQQDRSLAISGILSLAVSAVRGDERWLLLCE